MRSFIPTGALALAITALCSVSIARAAPAKGVAQEKVFSEWIEVIAPGLKSTAGKSEDWPPYDWRHDSSFVVTLDNTGEPANIYNIPGGVALDDAAVYYALQSGDFNVTLGDLESSGWWPYATFPPEMNRSLVVQHNRGFRHMDKYEMLKQIGGPAWILRARSEILREFYADFFFRRPEDAQRRSGMFTKEEMAARIAAEQQPTRTAGELPVRSDKFWLNPYTGIPMRISEEPGDLALQDISWQWQNATTVRPDGKEGGYHGSYYGGGIEMPKPAKLEVAMIKWNWEQPRPWHERVGQAPAPLPDWLAHGEGSVAAKAHDTALLGIFTPLEEKTGRSHELLIDDSAERAPLELLACPQALRLAAVYYAISTLDNQVSLSEIIDAGFWPYDTFPTWLDLSETLYDFPVGEKPKLYYDSQQGQPEQYGRPAGWQYYLAANMGSPEWLLWRRAEILNQVHAELFFSPHPDYAPGQRFDPQTASVLPRFAAFWVNPVASAAAGKPVEFTYGPLLGQLSTLEVNLLRPLYQGAPIRYDQQVPLINLADKTMYAAGAEPEYRYRGRLLQGVTEENRTWALPASLGGGLGELRWKYSEPNDVQDEVLLDVGWYPELQRAEISTDGRPADVAWQMSRAPYTKSYKLGAPLDNGFHGASFAHDSTTQIIFDSVAPVLKRYSPDHTAQPKDYSFVLSMIRGRFGHAQLPGGRAGIDELAPPAEPVEVAVK